LIGSLAKATALLAGPIRGLADLLCLLSSAYPPDGGLLLLLLLLLHGSADEARAPLT